MPAYTTPLGFPYPIGSDAADQLRAIFQQHAEAVDDYLSSLAAVAPVAWTAPSFTSGWANVSGELTRYARNAGLVTVALNAAKGTIGVGETIFILPVGFRPTIKIRGVAQYGNALRPFSVGTDGAVKSEIATSGGLQGAVTFNV